MRKLATFIFLFSYNTFHSNAQEVTLNGLTLQDSIVIAHLPEWVKPVLEKSELIAKHKIQYANNPYYFELDLTGDQIMDIVFYVENIVDHTKGLLIINGGKNLPYVLGCGNVTELGVNLKKHQHWFVYRERVVRNYDNKTTTIKFPGIAFQESDKRGMVVYWAGKKYKTFGYSW